MTESSNTVLFPGFFRHRTGRNDDVREHFYILQIARRMKQTGIIIRSNVNLVAFAGKEQGSLGSKVYAVCYCPFLHIMGSSSMRAPCDNYARGVSILL
ncbi:hypothetical protein EDD17DRAFT_1616628, partial [Pisolithus thermaeus]